MDKEPTFYLAIQNGEETRSFEATRDNASLWRHMGSLAIYNHAYFDLGEGKCTRVWRHDVSYEQVQAYMIAKQYPFHDNLREVNKHDADAYDAMIERQMADLDMENLDEGSQD